VTDADDAVHSERRKRRANFRPQPSSAAPLARLLSVDRASSAMTSPSSVSTGAGHNDERTDQIRLVPPGERPSSQWLKPTQNNSDVDGPSKRITAICVSKTTSTYVPIGRA
jgi:hypothetical protein